MPVTITNPILITRERPTCAIEVIPSPPEYPTVPYAADEDDILRRVFIHYRTYAEMVEFAHDLAAWARSVDQCVRSLSSE